MHYLFTVIVSLLLSCVLFSGCNRSDYSSLLSERALERFYFSSSTHDTLSLDIEGKIEGNNIEALMPHGTDLSLLTPSYSLDGYALYVDGKLQNSGETSEDFTSTLTYSLYSYDGIKDDYTVTVVETKAYFTGFSLDSEYNSALNENIGATIAGNSIWFYLPHCYNLSGITPSFDTYYDGPVIYNDTTIKSCSGAYSFDSPLVFRVYETAESDDREFMDYQVSAYRLKALIFEGQINGFDADYRAPLADDTITVELPSGTDLTRLKPTYSYLGKTITFNGETVESGDGTVDFSGPVSILVDTGCGISHEYTVKAVLTDDPQNEVEETISASDDITAPAEVTFAAADATSAQLTFNWTNPTDEDFDYLLVSVDENATSLANQDFSTGTSYTINSPSASSVYSITVQTVDTEGNVSNGTTNTLTFPTIPADTNVVLINTADTLAAINDSSESLSGYYIMTEDLDLNGVDWTPIGESTTDPFLGTFDGNGYTISGFNTTSSDTYTGLFGTVGDSTTIATIKNLNMEDVAITNTTAGTVGAVVGFLTQVSFVSDCTVSGSITAESSRIGGIVGVCYGTIKDSSSSTDIIGGSRVGGITGELNGNGSATGAMTNSFATGTISGTESVGGLIGLLYGGATCNYCYATGAVTGTSSIGGLVGSTYVGYSHYCYATGAVNGTWCVGGLIGSISSGSYTDCYSRGTVEGKGKVGGLIGASVGAGTTKVQRCYCSGAISLQSGASDYGPFLGYKVYSPTITPNYYNSDTAGVSDNGYGTGLSESEFIDSSYFSGFDFTTTPVWAISSSINDGYPYLIDNAPSD